MMQEMTDEGLMILLQKGEGGAMDELLRRYKSAVYGFALRLSRNAADAEEIAQEVFLGLYRSRASYRPQAKLRTWLFTIAHNAFVSRLRRNRWSALWPRDPLDPREPLDIAAAGPSPSQEAAQEDAAGLIKRCIQSLPLLQREALVLREYEKLDYAEIAEILHKPLGTIKTLLYRARIQLREKLLPYREELRGNER